MKEIKTNNGISRRKFFGTAAVAATAITLLPIGCKNPNEDQATPKNADGKPNSKFGGVQIGTITYSWRDQPATAEGILKCCKDAGISSIELMSDIVESYAGLPPYPDDLPPVLSPEAQARLDSMTKEYKINILDWKKTLEPSVWKMVVASIIGSTDEQKTWRKSVSMSKFEEFRKMYNDAGVEIHITKFGPSSWSDEEIDYAFKAAKALGAKGITDESSLETAKRLAPFAEKHGMQAIMHNHFQFADKSFNVDEILAVSPAVMLNFDCGHYFGSTGLNPVEFIRKYNSRIFSLHIKDKTGPQTTPPNENQVWGQGQVPLEEILLLLKEHATENDWPKYADIELEYPVAAWSDSVKEVKTCVAYARQILV